MNKFHRKSIRLKDYDYSRAGVYFVTICVHKHDCVFGKIENEKMRLNGLGNKVNEFWMEIPKHTADVMLDEFIVMPNHIHGIIVIVDEMNCRGVQMNAPEKIEKNNKGGVQLNTPTGYYSVISPKKDSLGVIIRTFKSAFTTWCRKNGCTNFNWQRSFYDRVIRNEKELESIQEYIYYNPVKWAWDEENPENQK